MRLKSVRAEKGRLQGEDLLSERIEGFEQGGGRGGGVTRLKMRSPIRTARQDSKFRRGGYPHRTYLSYSWQPVAQVRRKKGTATDSRAALLLETMGFHERESDGSPPFSPADTSIGAYVVAFGRAIINAAVRTRLAHKRTVKSASRRVRRRFMQSPYGNCPAKPGGRPENPSRALQLIEHSGGLDHEYVTEPFCLRTHERNLR